MSLGVLFTAFGLRRWPPEESVRLAWKFQRGEPFLEETTVTVTQTIRLKDKTEEVKNSETYFYRWEPLGQEQRNRQWMLERRLVRVVAQCGPLGPPAYDSDNSALANTALDLHYRGRVGTRWTVTIAPAMKVTQLVVNPTSQGNLERIFSREFVSEPAQRGLIEHNLLRWVPTEPVRQGDSWPHQGELAHEVLLGVDVGFRIDYEFSYLGQIGGREEIGMAMSLQFDAERYGVQDRGSSYRLRGGDLQVQPGAGGLAWFDRTKKRLAKAEMHFDAKGTFRAEIDGVTTPLELTHSTRSTVKITDLPPSVK